MLQLIKLEETLKVIDHNNFNKGKQINKYKIHFQSIKNLLLISNLYKINFRVYKHR